MKLPPRDPSAEAVFKISGMTCAYCVQQVREALLSVDGVSDASVYLSEESASVRWQSDPQRDDAKIIQALEVTGYAASLISESLLPTKIPACSGWRSGMVFAVVALAFFMVSEWILGWRHQAWFRWVAFVVALSIQIFCGSRFYASAWRQLKMGRSNMDTLVSLGSSTAFAYSVYILFTNAAQPLYFMESVGIIAFVSVGHYIEGLVVSKASGALESLMALTPNRAKLVQDDGTTVEVDAASLSPGQRIQIAPGEQVSVDGQILQGASICDESMLTGESLPVEKSAEQLVYAGTINLSGPLMVEVTGSGAGTVLARIIKVVESAQNSRAEVQKLADRISSVFVPIVVFIALGTMLWWMLRPAQAGALHTWLSIYLWSTVIPASAMAAGVVHSAAVLIIACPCAMGLATPMAIMAGINAAAKQGVLIRDGNALERSGTITQILFDKTGTLTQGKPEVVVIETFGNDQTDPTDILVALAAPSQHPLSKALAKHLSRANSPGNWTTWKEIPGKGIKASRRLPISGVEETYRLGSLRWLAETGANVSQAQELASHHTCEGATVIALATPQGIAAVIALRDPIKPGAAEVVQTLKRMKVSIAMVSGDQQPTATAIARELGIPSSAVHADTSPEQKASVVKTLQKSGEKVCFVGDGINDAPALEQADLGIAVRAASDIAKESADIILLRSDIQAILQALTMARATLCTIKQNLFWAFFYNTAGIPLAAFGFLSPLLCAAAMGLSDLVVIGNALRLRFRRFRTG
ncbi:MAG: putative copper-importing P-type ATPase A [Verrucomicrobia subdivision 3 bacterium]|nr:putative copper-importing P-type ATPase A [Limisphaerales bacterium]MCS1412690.1 putative copper-importing P-type ATPase A [Limisphaerales bacterium]